MEKELIAPFDKEKILANLISVDELNEKINDLLQIDVSNFEYEEIRKLLFQTFKHFEFNSAKFNSTDLQNISIYRARPKNETVNQDINSVSTFSYPPIDLDIGIGRANWRKRNVFYGADLYKTALLETKRLYDDTFFFVGDWRFDTNKIGDNEVSITVFINYDLPDENPWSSLKDGYKRHIESLHHNFDELTVASFVHRYNKFCELFLTENANMYPYTAVIADTNLYNKHNTNGVLYFPIIMYPSIANNKVSCNFAIHPAFVENYMYLEKVYLVEVLKENNSLKFIKHKKIGIPKINNKIDWFTTDIDRKNVGWKFDYIGCEETGNIIFVDIIFDLIDNVDSVLIPIKNFIETSCVKQI